MRKKNLHIDINIHSIIEWISNKISTKKNKFVLSSALNTCLTNLNSISDLKHQILQN